MIRLKVVFDDNLLIVMNNKVNNSLGLKRLIQIDVNNNKTIQNLKISLCKEFDINKEIVECIDIYIGQYLIDDQQSCDILRDNDKIKLKLNVFRYSNGRTSLTNNCNNNNNKHIHNDNPINKLAKSNSLRENNNQLNESKVKVETTKKSKRLNSNEKSNDKPVNTSLLSDGTIDITNLWKYYQTTISNDNKINDYDDKDDRKSKKKAKFNPVKVEAISYNNSTNQISDNSTDQISDNSINQISDISKNKISDNFYNIYPDRTEDHKIESNHSKLIEQSQDIPRSLYLQLIDRLGSVSVRDVMDGTMITIEELFDSTGFHEDSPLIIAITISNKSPKARSGLYIGGKMYFCQVKEFSRRTIRRPKSEYIVITCYVYHPRVSDDDSPYGRSDSYDYVTMDELTPIDISSIILLNSNTNHSSDNILDNELLDLLNNKKQSLTS